MIQRRHFHIASAAALLGSAGPFARAQGDAARRWAVLSQVGEVLHVVGEQPRDGSRLDRNRRTDWTLPDGGLDPFVLKQVRARLSAAGPLAAEPALLHVPGQALCERQRCIDGDRFTAAPDLAAALAAAGATHLILLTPLRAEANLRFRDFTGGIGMLEGLGFYLNNGQPLISSRTRERGIGWLGVYAYLRLHLIDLGRATVLKDESARESTTIANTRTDAPDPSPWHALDDKVKLRVLEQLVRQGLDRALPALLG